MFIIILMVIRINGSGSSRSHDLRRIRHQELAAPAPPPASASFGTDCTFTAQKERVRSRGDEPTTLSPLASRLYKHAQQSQEAHDV